MIIRYLLLINAIAFLIMLIDKQKAKHGQWRIPEKTLMSIACIGGSYGMFLGMLIFRHKTRHQKFSVGLPLLMAATTAIIIFLRYIL